MSREKDRKDDGSTTLHELKEVVENFVAQREWAQFHTPKNLAMAIGVEAGELMDLFRWCSGMESQEYMKQNKIRTAATEELADILICVLAFANRAGIDVSHAVKRKIGKNSTKYPADRYRGRF